MVSPQNCLKKREKHANQTEIFTGLPRSMGSTGNLPVPVGNLPIGMTEDRMPSASSLSNNSASQPIRSHAFGLFVYK